MRKNFARSPIEPQNFVSKTPEMSKMSGRGDARRSFFDNFVHFLN